MINKTIWSSTSVVRCVLTKHYIASSRSPGSRPFLCENTGIGGIYLKNSEAETQEFLPFRPWQLFVCSGLQVLTTATGEEGLINGNLQSFKNRVFSTLICSHWPSSCVLLSWSLVCKKVMDDKAQGCKHSGFQSTNESSLRWTQHLKQIWILCWAFQSRTPPLFSPQHFKALLMCGLSTDC